MSTKKRNMLGSDPVTDRILQKYVNAVTDDPANPPRTHLERLARCAYLLRQLDIRFGDAIDRGADINGADTVDFLVDFITKEVRPLLASFLEEK